MSTKRKVAKRAEHASTNRKAPAQLPPTVTVNREWLRECIECLDVDRFAMGIMRGLNDLAGSHAVAFEEQQKRGVCSERAAQLFTAQGFASEHEALGELRNLLESVEYVVKELREVVSPTPAVAS